MKQYMENKFSVCQVNKLENSANPQGQQFFSSHPVIWDEMKFMPNNFTYSVLHLQYYLQMFLHIIMKKVIKIVFSS